VVPATATGAEVRRVAGRAAQDVVLVADAERRPLGWARVVDTSAGAAVGSDGLLPYGHVFTVGRDSLRAALDSAVLSPVGRAVGVDEDGRVVGTVGQPEIAAATQSIPAGAGPGANEAGPGAGEAGAGAGEAGAGAGEAGAGAGESGAGAGAGAGGGG
jgi:osmoprotectant transport system ATP-binding protein